MAICSDIEESSSKDEHQECTNLCLMAHEKEVNSDFNTDPSLDELYDALDDLMLEYKKLNRKSKDINLLNKDLSKQLKIDTKEKENLSKENQKLSQKNIGLENLNIKLTNEYDVLKKELNKIRPFVDRFTLSSYRLDLILKNQKTIFDKVGLGYRSYDK